MDKINTTQDENALRRDLSSCFGQQLNTTAAPSVVYTGPLHYLFDLITNDTHMTNMNVHNPCLKVPPTWEGGSVTDWSGMPQWLQLQHYYQLSLKIPPQLEQEIVAAVVDAYAAAAHGHSYQVSTSNPVNPIEALSEISECSLEEFIKMFDVNEKLQKQNAVLLKKIGSLERTISQYAAQVDPARLNEHENQNVLIQEFQQALMTQGQEIADRDQKIDEQKQQILDLTT